jgi:hypothetical protein
LEASHDHLLIAPPSHLAPQNVKGFVVGLVGYGGVTTCPKILFCSQTVKEKIGEKIEDSVHLAKIPEMKSISKPRLGFKIYTS